VVDWIAGPAVPGRIMSLEEYALPMQRTAISAALLYLPAVRHRAGAGVVRSLRRAADRALHGNIRGTTSFA
jgi:hypothetical protein